MPGIKHFKAKDQILSEENYRVDLNLKHGIISIFNDEIIINLDEMTHLTRNDLKSIIAIMEGLDE